MFYAKPTLLFSHATISLFANLCLLFTLAVILLAIMVKKYDI